MYIEREGAAIAQQCNVPSGTPTISSLIVLICYGLAFSNSRRRCKVFGQWAVVKMDAPADAGISGDGSGRDKVGVKWL